MDGAAGGGFKTREPQGRMGKQGRGGRETIEKQRFSPAPKTRRGTVGLKVTVFPGTIVTIHPGRTTTCDISKRHTCVARDYDYTDYAEAKAHAVVVDHGFSV